MKHKYIIYDVTVPYYLVAASASSDDLPRGTTQFVDLQDETVILHRTDIPSCSLALLGVELNKIKRLCGYHLIFKELPKQVFRVSENKLLLNNINSISVRRTARNLVNGINKTIKFHSSQTFYTIPARHK